MSQPPAGDAPFGFKDEPEQPTRQTRKKSSRRAPSEAEVKKSLADEYTQAGREEADRRAAWEAPRRHRTGGPLIEHARLIGSGMLVLIGVSGVAVCFLLGLPWPFYVVPALLLFVAVLGFVYTWFGMDG